MENLVKESMKNVSGGQIGFYQDKTEKTWYLLFFDDDLPEGKITIEDFEKNKNIWAQRGFKQFVSENGVGGVVTDDITLAKEYARYFKQ